MKLGRPTSYRSEFCARVVELMREGRSLDGCAAFLGVNPDSLYVWQNKHPEFSEAVRMGRAAATAFWEDRLLDIATGKPGNAQAIQWALRNRSRAVSGWDSPHQKVELSGPEGAAVSVDMQATVIDSRQLNREERNALRNALMAVQQRT